MKKSLYLLLLLLFPIGLQAQSEVIVLHPDEGKAEVNEAEYTRIFLAGTIDMGKSIDWQKATCDWFRARPQGKYILYNPRRDKGLSGEMSDFEHQVNWELEHLEFEELKQWIEKDASHREIFVKLLSLHHVNKIGRASCRERV